MVVADAERLNRINVFPVPDGDTGTNLAATLGAVRAVLEVHQGRHAGRTLERVADAALDGARGNSGAILAQFFQGLCDACADLPRLATSHYVHAVGTGARYAREALAEPREGTILSVIRDYGEALAAELGRGRHDFADLLDRGLEAARASLARTTAQLEALRRAGVVDAGAQGFVDLLQGISDYVRHGREADPPAAAEDWQTDVLSPAHGEGDSQRWCTECLVSAPALALKDLRESLAGVGSSLVVAGGSRRARVHVHVDDPASVFAVAARFGEVSETKADDMRAQRQALAALSRTVAVVTDSAADLPEELLLSHHIHQVPARIHFGKRSYLDKIGLSPAEFYRLMAESPVHPTTSQPPPGDFRRLYQILASHHPGVVSIHITAWGSGTFQAAESAAARTGAGAPVFALDSRNASIGQGLVALRAAELAASGMNLETLVMRLHAVIRATRCWALLGSVRHAVRGGRVPAAKGWLARALRLEPILASFPDGRLAVNGALAGRRNRVARFARWVAPRIPRQDAGPWRLAVGHAHAPAEADALLAALRARVHGVQESFVTEIGTALGVHGGPGTLVVAVQPLGIAGD